MRILLIVQPERFDFYSYLKVIPNAEWFLLWYEKPSQMALKKDNLPLSFKEIFYWNQFRTPYILLNKIKPDRILFFEIIDLRQIALNIAAFHKGVTTFYLEHGAAGDKETALKRYDEKNFKKHKLPYLLNRLRKQAIDIVKAKLFYYSVVRGFESFNSYRKFLLLPFKVLKDGPNKVLRKNIFRERVPLKSIVFNKSNYEEFALYTGIKENEAVLTGVPFFDCYFSNKASAQDYVVYIDHPYLEEDILGWTRDHHKSVAQTLQALAKQKQTRLFIKLHPRSNKSLWENYQFDSELVTLLQNGDFTELYLNAKLILGFSSSLINGFLCARKNIVLLGWHPVPQVFGSDFSKTGLCHLSLYPTELLLKYDDWLTHNLVIENETAYTAFLQQFNYPFDGRATERVINAITQC